MNVTVTFDYGNITNASTNAEKEQSWSIDLLSFTATVTGCSLLIVFLVILLTVTCIYYRRLITGIMTGKGHTATTMRSKEEGKRKDRKSVVMSFVKYVMDPVIVKRQNICEKCKSREEEAEGDPQEDSSRDHKRGLSTDSLVMKTTKTYREVVREEDTAEKSDINEESKSKIVRDGYPSVNVEMNNAYVECEEIRIKETCQVNYEEYNVFSKTD